MTIHHYNRIYIEIHKPLGEAERIDPMNTFEKNIVNFVRTDMPDQSVMALVRNQLLNESSNVDFSGAMGSTKAKPSRAKKASAAPKQRRTRGNASELRSTVEAYVKASPTGLAASEVAKGVGAPQPAVARALKQLYEGKRIARAGERRFARYARNKTLANAAVKAARAN